MVWKNLIWQNWLHRHVVDRNRLDRNRTWQKLQLTEIIWQNSHLTEIIWQKSHLTEIFEIHICWYQVNHASGSIRRLRRLKVVWMSTAVWVWSLTRGGCHTTICELGSIQLGLRANVSETIFVYFHVRHLGSLFLRSLYHHHSKNITHVGSVSSFHRKCICVFVHTIRYQMLLAPKELL